MIKKIIIYTIIIAIALTIFAYMRPAEYHISKSITINAPKDEVFDIINDVGNWQSWFPWKKVQQKVEEALNGDNKKVEWGGEDNSFLEGEINLQSPDNNSVHLNLNFVKPVKAVVESKIILEANGEDTIVTWKIDSEKDFAGKVLNLMYSSDNLIAENFQKGLQNLKEYVESKNKSKKEKSS